MTAKASGTPMWTWAAAADKPKLDKEAVAERDQALQVSVGAEILALARFAGERGKRGDPLSLRLLTRYLQDILQQSTTMCEQVLKDKGL